MKKLRFWTRLSLESSTIIAVLLVAIFLLTFRLRKLLPGMSLSEQMLPSVHNALNIIWTAPFELPIHLSRLVVAVVLPSSGIASSRLPSVLLALLMAFGMYWLLRRWYGYRLALFGTALLVAAPWFLHSGRLATNAIVYPLSMITVLILAAVWHQPKRIKTLLYGSAVVGAIMLYVPGIVWLLVGVLVIERRNVLRVIKANKKHASLAFVLFLTLLIPLGHALSSHWQGIRLVAGLPQLGTIDAVAVIKHMGQAWQYIFVGGYHNPLYNLGGLAFISAVTSVLFAIGVYLHGLHLKSTRTKTLAYLWIVGTLLIGFGTVSITLILPIIIVLATGGVGYLLHLWLKVFPRNPLARGFGITLMAIMLCFTLAYDFRNYYIAWPHNPTTRAAFQSQP